ncbi:hypothetical protein GGP41_010447 [Bipolaris sorokiniana]|uniref:Uncharacterized protein n=1 Tax=Cochliobolus sativus TaxID=45130 RepID=A0A8H5ZKJ3_COCSA|nr:hypothetical protein GGP41_010447 [Bipolaris sorokiniana]
MSFNVALRARWRRALTSLTSLVLATTHNKLLSLLYLEHSTSSDILMLLTLRLSLTLIFYT